MALNAVAAVSIDSVRKAMTFGSRMFRQLDHFVNLAFSSTAIFINKFKFLEITHALKIRLKK